MQAVDEKVKENDGPWTSLKHKLQHLLGFVDGFVDEMVEEMAKKEDHATHCKNAYALGRRDWFILSWAG